jgi:hypothetical protein
VNLDLTDLPVGSTGFCILSLILDPFQKYPGETLGFFATEKDVKSPKMSPATPPIYTTPFFFAKTSWTLPLDFQTLFIYVFNLFKFIFKMSNLA